MAGGTKILVLAFLVVIAWLFIGTIVYAVADNCSEETSCSPAGQTITTQVCGWSVQESFYYSVQAGLSIGFGLLPESKDGSRLYTVFHILAGSSIIGGSLSFFVSMAIARNASAKDELEKRLLAYSQRVHSEGHRSFSIAELRKFMCHHRIIFREMAEKIEQDDSAVDEMLAQYDGLTPAQRRPLVDKVLKDGMDKMPELRGGKLSLQDLQKIHEEEKRFGLWLKSLVRPHLAFVSVWSMLFFWMFLGILFGLLAEKWSFIQSLYFAVSSLSTAGLQSVTRTEDGFHVLFAGLFALIGVPLYGAALGTLANILVDRYAAQQSTATLNSKLEEKDVWLVEHILGKRSGASEDLSLPEFIEVELLQLGMVDPGTLKQIRSRFQELDPNGTGKVSKSVVIDKYARKVARHTKAQAAPNSAV